MKIELRNRILVIVYDERELNSLHLQQLKFWGYKIDKKNGIIKKPGFTDKLLMQLIRFLDKKNIKHAYSEEISRNLNSLNRKQQRLSQAFHTGSLIKDGNLKDKNFTSFQNFLETLPRSLKEHQRKAAFHLYKVKNAANFSVPGSGKTTVVLSVYEKLRREGKVDRIFVVGPTASFEPWQEEFNLVLGRKPKSKVLSGGNKKYRTNEYYNPNSDAELLLTSFQTLLNDYPHVQEYFKHEKIKPYVVIDEAHYIKQIGGSWATAVLELSDLSEFRCILTGTPIPKSYADLYNQFNFLWPHNEIFNSRDKVKISNFEKAKDISSASDFVEGKIGPLFYRVRKQDLGLADQHFHDPILLEMNPIERKLHDAIEQRIASISTEVYLENLELINRLRRGRIIRLRQCVSYAKLLSSAIKDYDEELINDKDLKRLIINYNEIEKPSKLEYLIDYIRNDLNSNKLVVWSHFVGTIKLIERYLSENGIVCKSIFGETPLERDNLKQCEETREKIIKSFKDPNSSLQVLVANPAACAESISLHKVCNKAVYYDLSYNSAQFLQSLDRIHRVGGSEEKPSHYFFLQYRNTFENDILSSLKEKTTKMESVVDKEYDIYSLDLVLGDEHIEAYKRLFANE
jgi:ERCC4-related helicase